MARTRICFVGGGSYNWTPTLLTDIALSRDLAGTVVLHDLNAAALEPDHDSTRRRVLRPRRAVRHPDNHDADLREPELVVGRLFLRHQLPSIRPPRYTIKGIGELTVAQARRKLCGFRTLWRDVARDP